MAEGEVAAWADAITGPTTARDLALEQLTPRLSEVGAFVRSRDGSDAWAVILTPETHPDRRVVGLAHLGVREGVSVRELLARASDQEQGGMTGVYRQRWRRARIKRQESLLLEQLVGVPSATPGSVTTLTQRGLGFKTEPRVDGLVSLIVETGDLNAFEDVMSTCAAVLESVEVIGAAVTVSEPS